MNAKNGLKENSFKTYGIIFVLLFVPTLFVLISYSSVLESSSGREIAQVNVYDYHIVMITENPETPFWQDVYLGAAEEAEKYNVYIELVGQGFAEKFSIEESLEMVIYQNVDGILIQPIEGEAIEKMINKAQEYGIPVITMQKDMPNSKRQGFVGTNDYFLGQEYGKTVLQMANEQTELVTVLMPKGNFNDINQEWFRLGLANTISEHGIKLDVRLINDDNGLNDAESVLESIFRRYIRYPDIFICLDPVITQTAYEMITDQELVRDVQIIGYYVSDAILSGIENGKIHSTITIDSKQLGELSIAALMTYKQYNMVSYYTEVGTKVIDRSNIWVYREGPVNEVY